VRVFRQEQTLFAGIDPGHRFGRGKNIAKPHRNVKQKVNILILFCDKRQLIVFLTPYVLPQNFLDLGFDYVYIESTLLPGPWSPPAAIKRQCS